jgi:hypothetical protein
MKRITQYVPPTRHHPGAACFILEAAYVGPALLALFAAGLLPAPLPIYGLIAFCALAVAAVLILGGDA